MTKFYVALATPSIEVIVKAKDAFGNTGSILVGFRRYAPEEGLKKIDTITELAESAEFNTTQDRENAIKLFLKGEILFVKNVDVYTEEEPGVPVLYKTVEDSRTEKDQDLQGENSSCLDFLLDMLFASPSWGSAFTEVFYAVHMNFKLNAESEVKN